MVLSVGGVVAQAPPSSGPCPPGAVPIPGQGRCGSPAEAAGVNRGGSGSSAPAYTEIWEDRFGAIAEDPNNPIGGASSNLKSKRQAERLALKRCGSSNCKIVSSVRNTCQASAYGGGGRAFGGGANENDAALNAKLNCEKDGSQCNVTYAACSLPVRVR
ncbi:DUF4189 domain-containing protein [Solilutibacter pythonis]